MNEPTFHDPELQSLEARLSATLLHLPAGEQQLLLYQCAFVAGKKSSVRSLRCWQLSATVFLFLLVGMGVPSARDRWLPAILSPAQPLIVTQQQSPAAAVMTSAAMPMQNIALHQTSTAATVELDAWQLPPSNLRSFTEELARLEKSDPHLRSLTVGNLTYDLLNP